MKPFDVEKAISTLTVVGRFVQLFNLLSTVRYKRFKQKVAEGLTYHRRLEELLAALFTFYPNELVHPLLKKVKNPSRVDIVVFFTNRGFVGDLNSRLVKTLKQVGKSYEETYTIAVGDRAKKYREGFHLRFPSPIGNDGSLNYEVFKKLAETLTERLEKGLTDKVVFVYATPHLKGSVEPSREEREKKKSTAGVKPEYTFEPEKKLKSMKLSPGGTYEIRVIDFLPPKPLPRITDFEILNIEGCPFKLIDSLLRLYILFSLKFILLENLAAETLARLNTTSAINRRIEEKLKKLKLLKFKIRQEIITEELAEINAAISAMEENLSTGAVHLIKRKETLKVSPSLWKAYEEVFKKLFPSAEVEFEDFFAGFVYQRINFLPDGENPSVYIDTTVETLLKELEKFLKN